MTTRGRWSAFYATPAWRALRARFIIAYPLCSRCDNRTTVVDHIQPHKGDVGLMWAEWNLQPMCVSCHNAKTRTEDM